MKNRIHLSLQSLFVTLLIFAIQPLSAQPPIEPEYQRFYEIIDSFLHAHDMPGGNIAVSYRGKLKLIGAIGLADLETGRKVEPHSLFRIGSNSKPITATAIMSLYEDGLLDLDDAVYGDILKDLTPLSGNDKDPLFDQITVRHLLTHRSGWDLDDVGNVPSDLYDIALKYGFTPPLTFEQVARELLDRPPQKAIGEKFSYYNANYILLSHVVEKVSGMSYEEYCQDMLARVGIYTACIGRTLEEDLKPNEVKYYEEDDRQGLSRLTGEIVPAAYGEFVLETTGGSGGWIASGLDMIRFLSAMDGYDIYPDILQLETLDAMTTKPQTFPVSFYAHGWSVTTTNESPVEERAFSHNGSLSGTRSYIVKYATGHALTLTTNSRRVKDISYLTNFGNVIQQAFQSIPSIGDYDYFLAQPEFPLRDAKNIIATPKLAWYYADLFDNFRVQVATDSSFSNVLVDEVLSEPSYQIMDPLGSEQAYFWRVRVTRGGKAEAWSDPYSFTTEFTTSAILQSLNHQVKVFPNPARETISITLPNRWSGKTINIENGLGQLIQQVDILPNQNVLEVDISHLARGMYFIQSRSENQFFVKGIVVKN